MMPGPHNHNIKAFLTVSFLIAIIIVSVSCKRESFSPSQAESFIKFFGPQGNNEGFDVKVLDNGGYVMAGTTTTESGTNIILILTDKYGNESGSPKQFGGPHDDHAHSLIVLSDGGFAILGSTTLERNGVKNMYLIRTDSHGNELWTKTFGGNSNAVGYSLAETRDRGFILLGSMEHPGTKNRNIYMVKTFQDGMVDWTRTHGGFRDDVGLYIAEADYGFIYIGYTHNYAIYPQAESNIFIVKTNSNGIVTSAITYGSTGDDSGKSLILHPEGGYTVLGNTSNSSSVKNIYLSRIEENISIPLWTRSIGGSVNHVAACMKITPGGNYIITGTKELSVDNHVIFLLKTDTEGNEIFFETYGGSGLQRAEALDIAHDGGYVIFGSNQTGGNSMMTLIKTNSDGQL
jgi:hypothetical protein